MSTDDKAPKFDTSPGHPDEVVKPVEEKPSVLVAEAKLRHEFAETDLATAQEKKQAAVEQAHALSTRPDGSYAQLHEAEQSSLAVADDAKVKELRQEQEKAQEALVGSEPAGSPAGVRREEQSAKARAEAARKQESATK